ncbi:MAG: TIR domain-containing protein [Pseudomonadota bacterium]
MSTSRSAVFISYASPDAAMANIVVSQLERAGHACWIAPRDVVPGALYAEEIIRAINDSSIVVLVQSAQSVASTHVGKELERASSKSKRIVALRTDATPLPHAFEYFLSESQWIEVAAGGIEAAAARLVEAVSRHLKSGSSSTATRAPMAAQASVLPSIAVLPFANLSGDKEQEYFSDGLAEEIINALAKTPGLKVIARSSAFAFRGQQTDVRLIAETLGVAHVLEGSVRRAGNRIRVTAQLIAASDGTQLWSERYDRELADVFAVQDDIATAITAALQVKLAPVVTSAPRYTPKLPAYEALLKARHFHWKGTAEAMDQARVYHEQAIALDPHFALAYAEYAEYLMARAFMDLSPQSEMAPLSRAWAQKALLLDPSLTDAHGSLCAIAANHDRDWQAAHRHFLLAMPDGRSSQLVRLVCAWGYLLPSGQVDAAVEQLRLAVQDDPLHPTYRRILGVCLDAAGRHDEAESILQETAGLFPDHVLGMLYLSYHCFNRKRLSEAMALAESLFAQAPWFLQGVCFYAGLLTRSGQTVRGKEMLRNLQPESPGYNGHMAFYCLVCDEFDQAADWFEKALTARDANALMLMQLEMAKGLRASTRWPRLAQMAGLPEAAARNRPSSVGPDLQD